MTFAALAVAAFVRMAAPSPSCVATATSLTPAGWPPSGDARGQELPANPPVTARRGGMSRGTPLAFLHDIPVPGPAQRFDYQSIDTTTERLYVAHMGAGRLVVVDTKTQRVVASVPGFEGATGVWAVPERRRVYVSVTGRHEVAVVTTEDRAGMRVLARVKGARFPDGIAYAPGEGRVFVSDESGEAEVVIDARGDTLLRTIPLGGEAGNTHYDAVSHCVLVAVQTAQQLVAIDPTALRVVARYPLPGSDRPHGFVMDEPRRLAFVADEGNATLLTLDLRTMRVIARSRVGDDPDVLALDPGLGRLYIAAESGALAVFDVRGPAPRLLGVLHLPHAHSVAVDPRTHLVYLPLQNVGGRPVVRVMRP